MAAPDLVNLASLIDDAKCFALVRQHRWPEGVRCPGCQSAREWDPGSACNRDPLGWRL
jgi:hypothetical protein